MDRAVIEHESELAAYYSGAMEPPGGREAHEKWLKEYPGAHFAIFVVALFLFILGRCFERKQRVPFLRVDHFRRD